LEEGEYMPQMSEEEYDVESKKFTKYHGILELPLIAFFFIGVITSVLNVTIGGLTPVIWFMLSFWCILIIICMEVSMIRAFLESRK
jgi:hypothetical protein